MGARETNGVIFAACAWCDRVVKAPFYASTWSGLVLCAACVRGVLMPPNGWWMR